MTHEKLSAHNYPFSSPANDSTEDVFMRRVVLGTECRGTLGFNGVVGVGAGINNNTWLTVVLVEVA